LKYQTKDLDKAKDIIENLAKNSDIKEYEFKTSLMRLFLKQKDSIQDSMKNGIISSQSGEKLISIINKEILHLQE
jgi:hypothetical protein